MKTEKPKEPVKIKVKRGDKVVILAGKDKNREGKILVVDRNKGKVIVEGVNMVSRHQKAGGQSPQGGIIRKEAPIDSSNVMLLYKGKRTRIGFKVERKEVNGKIVNVKYRVAKTTGDVID